MMLFKPARLGSLLVPILLIFSGCASPEPAYDAGLHRTEEYKDMWPMPYSEIRGPWAVDPQYGYYEGFDPRLGTFTWEDEELFGPGRY